MAKIGLVRQWMGQTGEATHAVAKSIEGFERGINDDPVLKPIEKSILIEAYKRAIERMVSYAEQLYSHHLTDNDVEQLIEIGKLPAVQKLFRVEAEVIGDATVVWIDTLRDEIAHVCQLRAQPSSAYILDQITSQAEKILRQTKTEGG